MKKHYSWYNRPPKKQEVVEGESMTVPGQAMTVQDLLVRYRNGQSIPIQNNSWADDELNDQEIFEVPEIVDLVDAKEFELKIEKTLKKEQEKERKIAEKKEKDALKAQVINELQKDTPGNGVG